MPCPPPARPAALRSRGATGCAPATRSTAVATASPSAATSMVQSTAGRTRPARRLAAPVAQGVRVQGDPSVGQVQGLAPGPGLGVDGPPGGTRAAEVGDGVVDPPPAVGPEGHVEGLVEVRGARRVHGHQVDVGGVATVGGGVGRGLGRRHHLGREGGRQLQLLPQARPGRGRLRGAGGARRGSWQSATPGRAGRRARAVWSGVTRGPRRSRGLGTLGAVVDDALAPVATSLEVGPRGDRGTPTWCSPTAAPCTCAPSGPTTASAWLPSTPASRPRASTSGTSAPAPG